MLSIQDLTLQFSDFQRDYLYDFEIIRCPDALPSATKRVLKNFVGSFASNLRIPEIKNSVISLSWKGTRTLFAGPAAESTVSGTFDLIVSADWSIVRCVEAWANLWFNYKNGSSYPRASVLGTAQIIPRAVDKQTSNSKYILHQFVISDVAFSPFKKDSSNLLQATVGYIFGWMSTEPGDPRSLMASAEEVDVYEGVSSAEKTRVLDYPNTPVIDPDGVWWLDIPTVDREEPESAGNPGEGEEDHSAIALINSPIVDPVPPDNPGPGGVRRPPL